MLLRANAEGFAVPAFNYSDIWDFLAIVAFAAAAAAKASVPIFRHLDHCRSIETCRAAVDHRYPSVMIDASMHPLEKNIEMVRDVVGYAHARAAHVEAEVGRIKGVGYEGDDFLARVDAAVDTPLVLHGGTGIPEADVRRAIKAGIAKVNVGTIIHCTYMNTVRAELIARGENAYTLDVMKPVRVAIREVVKRWIVTCMADGKAKK